MKRVRWRLSVGLAALLPLASFSQAPRPVTPAAAKTKLEAVADTHLLMEGLLQSNYRGLNRLLKEKPTDAETWAFARGQALLLGESGNLLMLRPPRNQGQEAWMQRSADLREAGARLGRNLAARDYARSRAGVVELANVCNRCHGTFRIRTEIVPFGREEE